MAEVRAAALAEGAPETAEYHCEGCETPIAEHHKTAMLEAGEWRATATAADPDYCRLSPLGALFADWLAELGADRASVGCGPRVGRGDQGVPQHDPRRDVGRNRRSAGLAALYDRRETLETEALFQRAGLFLTAGADVQKGPDRGRCLGLGPRAGKLAGRSPRDRGRARDRHEAGGS